MINSKQFRSLIVRPVLETLGHWSQEAENLLVMIMSWESKGGTYLKQEEGPALGIYMMEAATYLDLYNNHINKDKKISDSMRKFDYCSNCAEDMIHDMNLATVMARIFFLRIKEPIPDQLQALALYAKQYWNTFSGKAKASDYYNAYFHFEGIAP